VLSAQAYGAVVRGSSNLSIASKIRSSASLWKRWRQGFISAFIAFHLIAISVWAFPMDTPLIVKMRDAISPYMLWSGLFQRWNMFAPEPVKVDVFIEGDVTLHDGEKRSWTFPRMENLSYAQRYAKERSRKFTEYLRMDTESGLWPDAARHIARLFANPANPPVLVVLVRNFSQVEPPLPGGAVQRTPWSRVPFYVYVVKSGDLK
jgi:hypothetical protein